MSGLCVYPTGSDALDLVLGGGLPAASTVILAGLPGTGKTILAEQFLFANASEDAPALYLTTLSEPLPKVVRYLQEFSFFDPERLPGVIHYQDVGQAVHEQGIAALPGIVEDLIASRGAAFVVVDSFKALRDLSPDPVAFRVAVFDLARLLAATGVTALLIGEYGPAEIADQPEFAIADGVVELSNRVHGVRDERTLRVHKLRGAAPLPGEHSFRIDRDGLHVFPRLAGTAARSDALPTERTSTGVPGLDELMGGGLWRGSATLVAGPSGVGKTMLGLRFLLDGAARGEPGLLASFQESPAHLARIAAGFGVDLAALERDGLLTVLYVSPLELDLVELFGQMSALLASGRTRRLVVDALGDMREAAIARDRFRSMVWSLGQYLALNDVTGVLLTESAVETDGKLSIEHTDLSYMADNLVWLRYAQPDQDGNDRVLQVVKTRGGPHDPRPHPYAIGPAGPAIVSRDARS